MDETPTFPEPPAPETPTRRIRKRTLAFAASVLLLCTAGGAAGGLALSSSLHGSTASDNTASALGNGYVPRFVPGSGGSYGQPFGGDSQNYQFPGAGLGTQQSGNTETTSSASLKQVVGLVRIQTTLGYQNGAAAGTGMILTSDGVVVTNHHVVAGATKIVVTVMSTGQQYTATLVGSDTSDDIAVLKLHNASGLATVQTNTSTVSVGQSVTAVGDAQGSSTFTASPGRATALNQTISPSDGSRTETLTDIIQYAADVMSGDSGGATYDSSGKVVGMTTAASTGDAQTSGYAIPIGKVLSIATDIESHAANAKYSYGLPAFIGVGVNPSAVVEQVYAGTGAAKSGLTAGDRIVAVNGATISNASQLQTTTRRYQAGQTIALTWITTTGQRESARLRLIAGPPA